MNLSCAPLPKLAKYNIYYSVCTLCSWYGSCFHPLKMRLSSSPYQRKKKKKTTCWILGWWINIFDILLVYRHFANSLLPFAKLLFTSLIIRKLHTSMIFNVENHSNARSTIFNFFIFTFSICEWENARNIKNERIFNRSRCVFQGDVKRTKVYFYICISIFIYTDILYVYMVSVRRQLCPCGILYRPASSPPTHIQPFCLWLVPTPSPSAHQWFISQ